MYVRANKQFIERLAIETFSAKRMHEWMNKWARVTIELI